MGTFALSSRRTASTSTDAPSCTGTVTRPVRFSAWGSPLFSSRRAFTAVGILRELVTVSSRVRLPGTMPRRRISSLKEVRVSGWAIFGSVT